MAVAEVRGPDPIGPLLFVNHKPSFRLGFEHERELQALTAARFVEELVGGRRLHVVVAGDFDAVPDAASMRFWRGLQSLDGTSGCYRDAWEHIHPGDPGHTFSPRNPLVTAGNWPLELGQRPLRSGGGSCSTGIWRSLLELIRRLRRKPGPAPPGRLLVVAPRPSGAPSGDR
jgi:hypothetical protein